MEGVSVSLLDTAGVREAGDLVERLGVQRSRAAAQAADIVLMIFDATVRLPFLHVPCDRPSGLAAKPEGLSSAMRLVLAHLHIAHIACGVKCHIM